MARTLWAMLALFTSESNAPARPKPRTEPLLREAGFELVLAIVPTVAKTAANRKQDRATAPVSKGGFRNE